MVLKGLTFVIICVIKYQIHNPKLRRLPSHFVLVLFGLMLFWDEGVAGGGN